MHHLLPQQPRVLPRLHKGARSQSPIEAVDVAQVGRVGQGEESETERGYGIGLEVENVAEVSVEDVYVADARGTRVGTQLKVGEAGALVSLVDIFC